MSIMGFRFRKRIRILPGISLNLGKSGFTSVSAGFRGFTVNLGNKGTKTTTSLPGTGLSYQSPLTPYQSKSGETPPSAQGAPETHRGSALWLLVIIVVLLWGVGKCAAG